MKSNGHLFLLILTFAVVLSVLLGTVLTVESNKSNYESYTDTITVNGQNLVYAVEGAGKPMLLLHGNGGRHSDMETTMRQLAQAGYRVYAPDSRGQGANQPLEEYHYIDMAEDMHCFLQALGVNKPVVFGWSDGGIVALQTEVMYPGTFSAIITSGANLTADNSIDPELFKEIFGDSTTQRPPLVEMMYREPNMTAEDMQGIACPALICAGENDLILREHTEMIAREIPAGKLMIFPGEDHGSHIWYNHRMGDSILVYLKEINY